MSFTRSSQAISWMCDRCSAPESRSLGRDPARYRDPGYQEFVCFNYTAWSIDPSLVTELFASEPNASGDPTSGPRIVRVKIVLNAA